jgi:hypothetical protein
VLNRHQDNLDLLFMMGRLERQNSFEWKDKAYVDVTDNLTLKR